MSQLYMIRLPVSLPKLGQWAARRNYGWTVSRGTRGVERSSGFDEGRALHHLLSELFGPSMLQPFRTFFAPGERRCEVYAYSAEDSGQLRSTAQAVGQPDVLAVCSIAELQSKAMPQSWKSGQRLGFEIRLRPISRLQKPLQMLDGRMAAKGAELDVFLIEALRNHPVHDAENSMLAAGRMRQKVYSEWLEQRLAGGATLLREARLTRFERRRTARQGRSSEGPDAVLRGELAIVDSDRFQQMLASGVGRHKAYGYGMLLLRPARGREC